MLRVAEGIGRGVVRGVEEIGFAGALFLESLLWAVAGPARRQPVRLSAVFAQMMQIGIEALPIATVLAAAIGMMLAIQSLYSLGLFGAESFATVGIALSVVREFAPLINLNVGNAWGILKAVVDLCLQLDEGKYLLLKDPNKPVVRFYAVPTDAFDEPDEPEPLPEEDDYDDRD